MKENKTSSILMEALTDYNAIKEAADLNAKKKLAEEFSEKFNSLLKEELDKSITNEEPDKKTLSGENEPETGETNSNNHDNVMKKQEKETRTVGEGGEKSGNLSGNRKNKKSTQLQSNEEFNITELKMKSMKNVSEFTDGDDELITVDEIEKEIASMRELDEEIDDTTSYLSSISNNSEKSKEDDFKDLDTELDEILQEFEDNDDSFDDLLNYEFDDDKDVNDENCEIDNSSKKIHQRNNEITDDEIEEILGSDFEKEDDEEESVEETLAMPYPNKRATTGSLPGKEYQSQGNVERMRFAMRESEKKIKGFIEANKKLTKKVNELKNYKKSVTELVEHYKSALEKYKDQLKEMALFNANLTHVNNLLMNESLALTQKDKIRIINEFKKVNSIFESQKKYKEMLSEMKTIQNTLTEAIENRVSASIHPSSRRILDEVIEKTAYENDEHLKKMKKIIQYVEKDRGK